MPLYTRTGDQGTTRTLVTRVSKDSHQVAALGALDTLHAQLAVLYEYALERKRTVHLSCNLPLILHDLLDLGTHVSALTVERTAWFCPGFSTSEMTLPNARYRFTAAYLPLERMEDLIDQLEASTPPLKNFILHTGTLLTAHVHVARCACRTAEAAVVAFLNDADTLEPRDELLLQYLNRLSDFLFALARVCTHVLEGEETVHA